MEPLWGQAVQRANSKREYGNPFGLALGRRTVRKVKPSDTTGRRSPEDDGDGVSSGHNAKILAGSRYFPSTENARRTLPGMLPSRTYPEFTKTIPPATTVPGPFSDPPAARAPLTV